MKSAKRGLENRARLWQARAQRIRELRGGPIVRVATASIVAAAVSVSAAQAEELRIGFMATLTGPGANLVRHLRDGLLPGVEDAGGHGSEALRRA